MEDNRLGSEEFGWIGLKIEGYVGVVADAPTLDLLTTYLEKTFICETEEEALEAGQLAVESGYSNLYFWVEYYIPDTATKTPPRLFIRRKPDVLLTDDV